MHPMTFQCVFSLVFVFVCSLGSLSCQPASSGPNHDDARTFPLKEYQELEFADFDFQDIEVDRGGRSKRQANLEAGPTVDGNRLRFKAYGRDFDIYLKRESGLVAENLDIEVRYEASNKPSLHLSDSFSSNFYVGFVQGESKSLVICYFERSVASSDEAGPLVFAQIQVQDEDKKTIYYIEPKQSAAAVNGTRKQQYIIYRSEDVASELVSNDRFNQSFCHAKFVNAEGPVESPVPLESDDSEKLSRQKRKANKDSTESGDKARPEANRCHLALVADHRFYKEIGNSKAKLTTAYLMNIVGAINVIFTQTPWILQAELDNELVSINYGFSIEKIIVHAEASNRTKHYNGEAALKNADEALVSFGEEDWTAYCLAHLFTFANFDGNVLGLAYVSSPYSYGYGGICSPRTNNPETRKPFSVNTGLSSYKSVSERQNRLLQREAELVTAHEFGHNWGSEHDPPNPECTPTSGSGGGNFIMYAYANQGHERNNNYFSPCSIKSIGQVLHFKSTCFKPEPFSYCGNYRIEEGEECDAGSNGLNDRDPCCDSKCRLRPGAVCSDSNHECCSRCQVAAAGRLCYSSPTYLDCFEDHSVCNGVSKDCPVQKPKPQGTKCNSFDLGRCDAKGHCLSLCQQRDFLSTPCLCSKPEERCMVCCRAPSRDANVSNECVPYHMSFNLPEKDPFFLSNGRACYNGLCENTVCKPRVKDYVSRFWKVIQNVTVSAFVGFMKRNIVGSIILISLLVWVPISCCIHFCVDKRYRNEHRQRIQSMKSAYMKQRSPDGDSDEFLIGQNDQDDMQNSQYVQSSSL